jgi:hypothetical protein
VRVLHVLHGSLMVPGVGRQIVGWVGLFMLVSCLTGMWLWWPVTGSVRRGFRWRRQPGFNANLHHQLGFWVLVPLAMLSFTGVWISFPQAFGRFEASAPKAPGPGPRGPRSRWSSQPLARTAGGGRGPRRGRRHPPGAQRSPGRPTSGRNGRSGSPAPGGTAEVTAWPTRAERSPPPAAAAGDDRPR